MWVSIRVAKRLSVSRIVARRSACVLRLLAKPKRDAAFAKTRYKMRNLWNGQIAGNTSKALSADVPGHDVLVLRLTAPAAR